MVDLFISWGENPNPNPRKRGSGAEAKRGGILRARNGKRGRTDGRTDWGSPGKQRAGIVGRPWPNHGWQRDGDAARAPTFPAASGISRGKRRSLLVLLLRCSQTRGKKKKKGVRDFWWRSRSSPPNLCPDCFSLSLPSPSKPPMVLISSSSAGTPQTFLAPLWHTGQWGK